MQEFIVRKLKYIALPKRLLPILYNEFGVTSETVRLALEFKTNGDQPEAIRAKALEMGGFIAVKAV